MKGKGDNVKGERMDEIERILFRKFFVEQLKFDKIAEIEELDITREAVSKKYSAIKDKYSKEYKEVRRLSNNVYHAKKRVFGEKFKFGDFPSFYDWWMSREDVCFYCQAEQYKIKALVEAGRNGEPGGIYSSQMKNRGRNLELERKQSDEQHNEYSPSNCELVCYFCNNDKSNVISWDDYKMYFKDTGALVYRKHYIDKKYEELIGQQKSRL